MVVYAINPAQSWLFQLANAFLFVSYIWPSTLALRVLLTCGNCCFMLWGWLVLPFSIDTVLWNAFFMIVNFIQTLRILRAMMPVRFDADRTVLYEAWFAKGRAHHIAPGDFKQLTAETPFTPPPAHVRKHSADGTASSPNSRRPSLTSKPSSSAATASSLIPNTLCFVRDYAEGEVVAAVGSRANTLSVILSGRCIVEAARSTQAAARGLERDVQQDKSNWRPVAILRALDFTDSPEWVARSTERRPLYSVQIRVDSPGGARIFHWNAAALDAFLAQRYDVQGVLLGVVGMDLARKVFSANVDKEDLAKEVAAAGDAAALSQARMFHQKGPQIEEQILLSSYSSETQTQPAAAAAVGAEATAHPTLPVMPAAPTTLSPSASPSPSPDVPLSGGKDAPFLEQRQALVSLVHLARGTQGKAGVLPAAAGALTHEDSCPLNNCSCTCYVAPVAAASTSVSAPDLVLSESAGALAAPAPAPADEVEMAQMGASAPDSTSATAVASASPSAQLLPSASGHKESSDAAAAAGLDDASSPPVHFHIHIDGE